MSTTSAPHAFSRVGGFAVGAAARRVNARQLAAQLVDLRRGRLAPGHLPEHLEDLSLVDLAVSFQQVESG
jgi:hypothetical protein